MKTIEAIKKAREANLDLVVIAHKAEPPVAKILDFNKFLYDERKKSSASKAKSKKSQLKELRFGPRIGEADLAVRIGRAREFLEDNHRVRIRVRLRGRERAFPELGFKKIEKMMGELEDISKPENKPKLISNNILVTLTKK